MNIRVYRCEESIDGIFTAIYHAWSSRYGHSNIRIQERWPKEEFHNIELFSEYIEVETDLELSMKVAKSIKQKISREAFDKACRVALSDYEGKADLIYRFLILGFAIGKDVLNHLSNDVVRRFDKVSAYVGKESHNYLGFVRFTELENGVLSAVIQPKNNILSLITPHFVDRLSRERFIIYDESREIASVYIPGNSWFVAHVTKEQEKAILASAGFGDEYENLWKIFFKSIAIKERENYKLQRNMLPIRYRDNMIEFQE